MQVEVKFQGYQLSYDDDSHEEREPIGPQFSTPEEAREYLRTKIPTLLKIDTELSDGDDVWIFETDRDEDRFFGSFIIMPEVENFPQVVPWVEWL